ncbi:MAG: pyridoxamine 5'-phosphate oxidase family protein [Chloroflexi bacterium]|nr:pyridoxamine 5'-phosphate oxidase family protein [Chloroflexota bacterium]
MGKVFEVITEKLQAFIRSQHLFFVATAPLSDEGHINLSPKGLDCFRILSENQVAYLDLVGSGNETSAHLLENSRITLMFCALNDAPMILRLYGQGRVVLPGNTQWDDLISHFPFYTGIRQIVVADIDRVQTSCGFGVPLYDYQGERDALPRWAEQKGEADLVTYQREKNWISIDGLPTPLSRRE